MGNIQEITNRKKQKTNKLQKTIFKLPDKTILQNSIIVNRCPSGQAGEFDI